MGVKSRAKSLRRGDLTPDNGKVPAKASRSPQHSNHTGHSRLLVVWRGSTPVHSAHTTRTRRKVTDTVFGYYLTSCNHIHTTHSIALIPLPLRNERRFPCFPRGEGEANYSHLHQSRVPYT